MFEKVDVDEVASVVLDEIAWVLVSVKLRCQHPLFGYRQRVGKTHQRVLKSAVQLFHFDFAVDMIEHSVVLLFSVRMMTTGAALTKKELVVHSH